MQAGVGLRAMRGAWRLRWLEQAASLNASVDESSCAAKDLMGISGCYQQAYQHKLWIKCPAMHEVFDHGRPQTRARRSVAGRVFIDRTARSSAVVSRADFARRLDYFSVLSWRVPGSVRGVLLKMT